MAILPADLRTQFPKDFTSADTDGFLQIFINRAYRQLGDAWGNNSDGLLDDGATYLAAHLATVAKRGANGVSGPVQSKKVGELSVTYAAPLLHANAGALGTTAFGLEFLRLVNLLPGARVFVDQSDNFYDQVPGQLTLGWDDGHGL